MTMQRRHYNAIAAALRSGKATNTLVTIIAQNLAQEHMKFDFNKFITKALHGPTQEQRSAKYRSVILARSKLHATPRHISAAIPAQHDQVGGVSSR